MKRIFTLLFLMAMTVMVLAACGSASDDEKNGSKEEPADKEKLIIGIDDHFAPMGFRDENNEIVGFDIDMARAAAEKWVWKWNSNQSIGQQKKANYPAAAST